MSESTLRRRWERHKQPVNKMRKKEELRLKRHKRIKTRMLGTQEKPRLVVHRSLKNISAQVLDDTVGKVLFSLSTKDKAIKQKFVKGGDLKSAVLFGELFALTAKEKGFSKVIFDRAGYLYHGRIKSFADALRKGGMEF